jgi:hypothetical protein
MSPSQRSVATFIQHSEISGPVASTPSPPPRSLFPQDGDGGWTRRLLPRPGGYDSAAAAAAAPAQQTRSSPTPLSAPGRGAGSGGSGDFVFVPRALAGVSALAGAAVQDAGARVLAGQPLAVPMMELGAPDVVLIERLERRDEQDLAELYDVRAVGQ